MKKCFGLCGIFLFSLFVITGCEAKKVEDVKDNEKVAIEYRISKKNTFCYVSDQEVFKLFDGDSAILFLGYPENDYSREIATILSEVTKNEILYYNPRGIMAEKNDTYKKLLKKIDVEEIKIPSVYFIKNGKIMETEASLSVLGKSDYLRKEDRKRLRKTYQNLIKKYETEDQ